MKLTVGVTKSNTPVLRLSLMTSAAAVLVINVKCPHPARLGGDSGIDSFHKVWPKISEGSSMDRVN